ncbi:ABC transporter substrate-binding protein [Vibrio scophthalmi]|uniref:ABC transporter substrate-binding protein n=1 Tax=Vibrio scophthalmi TaxID=45658 RepID=UPI000ABE766B|nr:ABC transporter substrate-binding protein [Vibrio scophthalmi]
MRDKVVKQLIGLGLAFFCACSPVYGQEKQDELVILTTFSREPLNALIEQFSQLYPQVEVRLIHRRTQSAIQLLNRSYIQDVDMVLSSSPFLMQQLAEHDRLNVIKWRTSAPQWMKSFILPPKDQVAVLGYSGAGIVWNQDYLTAKQLPAPQSFAALIDPIYFGHIAMSTPSRSGTTQLMIESILHQYGWEKGWRIILNVGANLGTISARSFGVSDYVAKGQFGIGPTIDSYALLLQKGFNHLQFSYDQDFTLMPTYIAEVSDKGRDQYTQKFVQMLLSNEVQAKLDHSSFAKHALMDDQLYSDALPTIAFSTVMMREQLINKIFDMAITKRLPMLKDSWLAITTLEKQLTKVEHLERLAQIKILLFTLPFDEREVQQRGESIMRLNAKTALERNQSEVLMAEFDHQLTLALAESMAQVEVQLKDLKAEAK